MNILKRKELVNRIIDYDSHDWVKLLTGVRRSGKTTLIKTMIEELKRRGVSEENILYISFRSWKYEFNDYYEMYNWIKDTIDGLTGKVYLFFDDVEEYENWQGLANHFRKRESIEILAAVNHSKFYILGDCELAGRSMQFEVYPFSFKEFVEYKKQFTDDESISDMFIEYLKFGGMPETLQYDEPSDKYWILEDTFNVIKYCDFKKDSDLESFLIDDFLRYMRETFTESFSKKQLNRYLYGMFDSSTTSKCLSLLEKSKFMPNSHKLHDNYRFQLDDRYYMIDHGFFNQANHHFNYSPESLLKNIVYVELLRRGYHVFYYQKRERYIDFVATKLDKTILIQFDYIFANDNIIKNEIRDLNSYPHEHEKYIITTGDYDLREYGVKHLNIIDFLMGSEI